MDEKILNIFRKYPDQHISGEDLSGELGISRTAVWKHIEDLRRLGYTIEAQPHLGYRLTGVPDRLLATELTYGLNTKIIGKKILSFDIVDSTMDVAYNLAIVIKGEGICVFSEAQKKGRGRMGRDWQSPKYKGICVSVVLRPDISPSETPQITLMAAVSVSKAIRYTLSKFMLNVENSKDKVRHTEETSKKPTAVGIKWPNDVLIDDKKVCGILTEMNAESDRVKFLVVGIGINVNAKASELPKTATSIKEIIGERIDRLDFAKLFLEEFDKNYIMFKERGFQFVLDEWRNFSATLGRRVRVDFKDRQIEGQAMDVDETGALVVRLDSGFVESIYSGDVILVR